MWSSLIKPGTIYRPASRTAGVLRRGYKQDLSGFLAIHPCLCLAPRPRPSRQDLTAHGLVGAAPGLSKPKAPACNRSRGSLTRLWHLLSTLHERRCRSHARLASGWRAAPFPGGCRTLWITYMRLRVSRVFSCSTFPLLPSVSRGSRGRKSALMARQAALLGRALAVNPRSPEGRAERREGLTARARAELQWCQAITLQM